MLAFKGISIFSLLRFRCPSAIPRFVVAILIGIAVYGMGLGRFQSHVCIEIAETGKPTITDLDSLSAVILPSIVFGVVTPTLNIAPSHIFRPFEFVRSARTMNEMTAAIRLKFTLPATATLRCSSFSEQIPSIDIRNLTAVAETFPAHIPFDRIRGALDNSKPSEPLTNQISDLHQEII
jgi:hypothetical protein